MKSFIIFCFYLSLAYGGIIKATERSEPIAMSTTTIKPTSKMNNGTLADDNATSDKSLAVTRDEEATIMLAYDNLFTASSAAALKKDSEMDDLERSGKLLLSTPKLTEKNNINEKQKDLTEENLTKAQEMETKNAANMKSVTKTETGTERNFINKSSNNKKDEDMPSTLQSSVLKIPKEADENLKEMEKKPKRDIQIETKNSNLGIYHLDHEEPLDYVYVVHRNSHASDILEADLHSGDIVESAHFVPASIESEIVHY